jgi:RecB family exonuclease
MRRKQRLAEILRDGELRRQGGKPDAEKLADAHVAARMHRVEEWLETPGAAQGAARSALLAVAARVRTWLQKRVAKGDPNVYGAAVAQAQALTDALSNDTRATFSREEARHLLDTIVRASHGHALSVERAGRVPHVAHPSAVLASAASVVFWGFVAGTEGRPALIPWNQTELKALLAADVVFPDPAKLLAAESSAWRRAVLAAEERVVFVVPSKVKGAAMSPHPMWDEIRARLGLEDDLAADRVTRHVQKILHAEAPMPFVKTEELPSLPLPDERGEWVVGQDLFATQEEARTSATALTTMVSCPFSWVLARRAHLRSGAISEVANGPRLNGTLSHRLVEKLFQENAFDRDEEIFLNRADDLLVELIRSEGATLLLPGSTFERAQLVQQILRAMRALHRYLRAAGFQIAAVEEPLETDCTVGKLHGRLDMRLVDANGQPAILDLKWGAATYAELLEEGRSVQLAAYSHALRSKASEANLPPAAYFALSSGRVLTVDARMKAPRTIEGASLEETWRAIEKTAALVKNSLVHGRALVAATKRALPILQALELPEADHPSYFASSSPEEACKYCDYPAICGRAWEDFQ